MRKLYLAANAGMTTIRAVHCDFLKGATRLSNYPSDKVLVLDFARVEVERVRVRKREREKISEQELACHCVVLLRAEIYVVRGKTDGEWYTERKKRNRKR